MGHGHHGHAFLGKVFHNIQHFAHHFGVQCAGGFVKQHYFRLHAQGAHNGHALLLAARKLHGVGIGAILQAHTVQQLQGLFLGGGLVHVLYLDGGNGQVFQNGFVGKQVEMLEHHAHFLAVFIQIHLAAGNVDTVEHDLALGGLFQQVQAA